MRLAAGGVTLLDCPLSGTGAQARAKDLIVYVSGDEKTYRRTTHVMDGFARAHYFVGPFGAGSKMKFIANLLVAIHNVAAAEAMVLAMKSGLDPELVVKVIGDGAGSSRMFQLRAPMMVKDDYSEATMKVQIWQKDMSIIGEFAKKLECPTPLFAASAPIYTAAMAMGLGAEDTAAVCKVIERMANSRRLTTKKPNADRILTPGPRRVSGILVSRHSLNGRQSFLTSNQLNINQDIWLAGPDPVQKLIDSRALAFLVPERCAAGRIPRS